jgi:hypothetical protein
VSGGPAPQRAERRFDASERRAGHTRITSRALTQAVEAVTAQAFGLPAGTATAGLRDDAGLLAITVAVPLAVPPLLGPPAADPAADHVPDVHVPDVFEQSEIARAAIIKHTAAVTGTIVSRVDIRLTGSHRADFNRADFKQAGRGGQR